MLSTRCRTEEKEQKTKQTTTATKRTTTTKKGGAGGVHFWHSTHSIFMIKSTERNHGFWMCLFINHAFIVSLKVQLNHHCEFKINADL